MHRVNETHRKRHYVEDGRSNYRYNVSFWKIWKHKRFIVAIFTLFGFMNIYALRTNLNIAIVDMTSGKPVVLNNGTVILVKEFDWSSEIQGYVLSSFFYGYILTQALGGYLAAKFGGTKVFGFGIASTAVLTFITPWVAKTNVYLLIIVRTIMGICEGVTYPANQQIWAQWAPPAEKSRLVNTAMSGAYLGAVVAMPAGSFLATVYNWESIFYTFGTLGLVWYILWLSFIFDSPSKDSRISPDEMKYIIEAINAIKTNDNLKVPWAKILTSVPVWANTICLTCETWGYYTMLTFLPLIMKSLLGFDLNKAGIISAAPYLATSIVMQLSGFLADFLVNRKYLSITKTRKLIIIFGFLNQSIFLLIAAYWVSSIGIPLCLILGVGMGGCALGAVIANPLDLSPRCASIIFGLSNTIGTLSGIISPIATGYIVTDQTNINQWRIVFFISSGVYFIGVIVSFLFTSGERQPWSKDSFKNDKIVNKSKNTYINTSFSLSEEK